ncbi:MAG: Hsp20 family protein [Anaerolineales bacterium]|nr:Hsp20 family protein [Anaerolineales bacterium]
MMNYYLVPRIRRGYRPVGFNGGRRLPVDIHADSEAYVITADVPGLKAEDIRIDILDDVVTLRGEFKSEVNGDGKYLLRELHYGEFTRSLRLPVPLDPENAEANVEDGVLTVRIPKAEEARPKEIKVNAR